MVVGSDNGGSNRRWWGGGDGGGNVVGGGVDGWVLAVQKVFDVMTQAPGSACAGFPRGARMSTALALETRNVDFFIVQLGSQPSFRLLTLHARVQLALPLSSYLPINAILSLIRWVH
jgi:hypothetical protein